MVSVGTPGPYGSPRIGTVHSKNFTLGLAMAGFAMARLGILTQARPGGGGTTSPPPDDVTCESWFGAVPAAGQAALIDFVHYGYWSYNTDLYSNPVVLIDKGTLFWGSQDSRFDELRFTDNGLGRRDGERLSQKAIRFQLRYELCRHPIGLR
jgi:hypothetical protein